VHQDQLSVAEQFATTAAAIGIKPGRPEQPPRPGELVNVASCRGPGHRQAPRPCPLFVLYPVPGPPPSPRPPGPASPQYRMQTPAATSISAAQTASEAISAEAGRCPDP